MNMGEYRDLATCIKQLDPWLENVHCLNCRMEQAFKDAFEKIPPFQKIENFLLQLHYLYVPLSKKLNLGEGTKFKEDLKGGL